ncbi:hypothetical protein [Corynebacterium efficiens YS-314]|uniref:Uncharacterized protein n=1 Tax=Corynebacterium efficiens (strain DSM 44549 / YS-314 / AJ 12310 / JCM 11189 / NBRC 100395) TaxID=196164 RepID=Q8FUE6_COREF|nr:hypothetical protein [Corynebacterium efficiens YS-314]
MFFRAVGAVMITRSFLFGFFLFLTTLTLWRLGWEFLDVDQGSANPLFPSAYGGWAG